MVSVLDCNIQQLAMEFYKVDHGLASKATSFKTSTSCHLVNVLLMNDNVQRGFSKIAPAIVCAKVSGQAV